MDKIMIKWAKSRKKIKKKKETWVRLLKQIKGKPYNVFLQSEYWQKVRRMVLKRDKRKCILCGAESNLQIHHNTYKHHFNEHRHLETLDTVCESCHKDVHMKFDIK